MNSETRDDSPDVQVESQNGTQPIVRIKQYPENATGPFISKDLVRKYTSVHEIKKVEASKLRVIVNDLNHANDIVRNQLFRLEYHVYIPCKRAEIDGVISELGLDCAELLKSGRGIFKNKELAALRILECRRLKSVNIVGNEKEYVESASIRITFSGKVLPDFVEIEKVLIPVRLFIPRVMFCQQLRSEPIDWEHNYSAEEIARILVQAGQSSIPRTKGTPAKRAVHWWNPQVEKIITERRKAQRRLKRTDKQHPSREEKEVNFRRLRNEARRTIDEAKHKSWSKFLEGIFPDSSTAELWRKVNALSGKRRKCGFTLEVNGKATNDPELIARTLGEHFASLFSDAALPAQFIPRKRIAEAKPTEFPPDTGAEYNKASTGIELAVVLATAKGKSAGADEVCYPMLTRAPPEIKRALLKSINGIWNGESFPKSWKSAIIVPIPKRCEGNRTAYDFRPINLLPCIGKTMERMVNRRLTDYMEGKQVLDNREILKAEAEAKWNSDQAALVEKENLELKQYNQRRAVLFETVKFFRKIEKTASDSQRELLKQTEWEQYVSCEKHPNPSNAADLREFLYRWTYELEEHSKRATSWTLDINDRSPLTQNELDPVETRKLLQVQNQSTGYMWYLSGIRNALKILTLIESTGQYNLSQNEVVLVRDEIRQKIADVLNDITMRVGGNMWRDMTPIDSITAEFQFTSDILKFYMWSFRDVPLPPEYNYLVKSLTLTAIETTFSKPPSFDLKDSLIRAFWTRFDHFSDLDPTFRCSLLETVPDLIAAQEMEWAERNKMRTEKLQEMKSAREQYEADKQRKELEEAENAKQSATPEGEKKAGKVKKNMKGKKDKEPKPVLVTPPPIIAADTTVDIEDDFVQQEVQQYKEKMERICPESLNLNEGYVNLRNHRITGGIYTIGQFDKLPQSTELRCDFIYTSSPLDLKLNEKTFASKVEEELIKLEFKLPNSCFWWHEPVVCSWEIWEDSEDFHSLDRELQEYHLNYEKIMEEKAKLLFSAPKVMKNDLKPTFIPDFNMNEIPTDVKLHFLITDHILPRLPQRFKFYAEMHALFKTMQSRVFRDERLKIEEQLNELLYPKFVELQSYNNLKDDTNETLRLPSAMDAPKGKESVASLHGPLIPTDMNTPVQSILYELGMEQMCPSYLFPPNYNIPLLVITEKKELEECKLEIEDIIQEMYDNVASDDEFSSENTYKLFSTFLKLLDHLREKEQPKFPDVVTPGVPEDELLDDSGRLSRIRSASFSHRHRFESMSFSRRLSSFVIPTDKKTKKKKKAKKLVKSSSIIPMDERRDSGITIEQPIELALLPHPPGRWSTKLVRRQEYDPIEAKLTIWVERLGTFGFAMEKYYNLPFKSWDIRRTGKIIDLTTTITLKCVCIEIAINVTKSGYRIEFLNAPQNLKPPASELTLDTLEKSLTQMNITIFPEQDAPFYVHNMTTPKHESMEMHNLKCMAAFCLTHNFTNCFWNKYAPHREALIQSRQLIEGRQEPEFVTVSMNPLKASTVLVEELCSPLDQVLLGFQPVPENQPYNPDVYNLLKDTLEEPSRKLLQKTPPMLQWNVAQLLLKLRLLSFS
ncbi:uncharacterized protein LOC131680581 [Topomyia yanbarensis]|uniref:uncharacterized protein LOC131680581 n=1 Tax=Topomyia yanbarensis TaxID=2498891 RepID=UPI00273C3986|nr:uncharacterized protein LOC131680581 [Topomyia yanbarensis]